VSAVWGAFVAWMCAAGGFVTVWAVLGYRAKTRRLRNLTHTTPKENRNA
jgi:hypothetical protein